MAYIVPSDLTQLALSGAHGGELETLDRLKTELSPDYTVYHGVHWTRAHKGHTVFGEADFVVVNRAGQVLVIEQKNGPLEETAEGLVKRYEDGAKNVQTQVRRSVDAIKNKFQWRHGRDRRLDVDYLVYCPDHRMIDVNAAGLDSNRIVDAAKKQNLGKEIETILGPGNGADAAWCDTVERFFRQTFELVPDVHAHVTSHEKAFTRLSGGLADILENLEMSPFRLRVRGCAGSGKTAVATRFYERALAAGRKPLLVCFNRPLREKINAIVPGGGLVQTWYGLCAKFLEDRGHQIDYSKMPGNPDFWREIQDKVIGESVPEDWKFSALIIDEAQDFQPEWFEILELFLKSERDTLWLEDANQNIRQADPSELAGFVTYRARTNYRSPESIARFIQKTLPFDFDVGNELPGLGVGLSEYDQADRQPSAVARIVGDLVQRGFKPEQIVILTMRGHDKSVLSDRERVGNFTLSRFTGGYDLFGNQIMSSGQIRFDSIHRFKGQQAPAVVLVDVDPDPERFDHWQRLLYCGMTRATVRLELVANADNPANRVFLEA